MVEAKKKELKSFFDNRVWEFTGLDDVNHGRTVTACWVLTWKERHDWRCVVLRTQIWATWKRVPRRLLGRADFSSWVLRLLWDGRW